NRRPVRRGASEGCRKNPGLPKGEEIPRRSIVKSNQRRHEAGDKKQVRGIGCGRAKVREPDKDQVGTKFLCLANDALWTHAHLQLPRGARIKSSDNADRNICCTRNSPLRVLGFLGEDIAGSKAHQSGHRKGYKHTDPWRRELIPLPTAAAVSF